ncbi:MAG: glycosyltransferase [Ideonella sp.]
MHIVLLAQCITEACVSVRDNRRYLSAAGRKKVLNLAAYLNSLGHQVSILSNSYAKGSYPQMVEQIGERMTVWHAPTWALGRSTPFRRGLAAGFNLRWLRRHRSQIDLAIIYNYHLEYSLPALCARRWLALPFVLDYEDGLYLVRHYQRPLYRWIERAVYRGCSAVIVVNPGLRQRMLACGVDKPTAVINGYFNAADVAALTAAPGTQREILFAGNFSRGFGFDELQRYIQHCPSGWTINVCGRGGPAETEALRRQCDASDRATFLGFVTDQALAALQQRAMAVIVLNDNRSEFNQTNFPSKLFDHLSAGKTIVCTANQLLAEYAGLSCMVQLDSIEHEFAQLDRRLADARFVPGEVVALHNDMRTRLVALLEAARRSGNPQ